MASIARRAVVAGALGLLLACGACAANPSPSPTGALPSPTASASAGDAAATAQFNLFLRAPVPHTTAFRLFVQTDPPAVDETHRVFCGSATGDPQACDPSRFPLTVRVGGLMGGSMLSYRFERVDSDGSVETLDQGSARLDRALIREFTYPTPAPTPRPTP